jgi:hypothetical protein
MKYGQSAASVFAQRAVNFVSFDVLEPFTLVAFRANWRAQNTAMLEA